MFRQEKIWQWRLACVMRCQNIRHFMQFQFYTFCFLSKLSSFASQPKVCKHKKTIIKNRQKISDKISVNTFQDSFCNYNFPVKLSAKYLQKQNKFISEK